MKHLPIHHWLVVIYPILFLYSHNIREVKVYQVIITMLIAIIITCIIWLIVKLFVNNNLRSALLVTFFCALFFSYGHILEYIEDKVSILYTEYVLFVLFIFLFMLFLKSVNKIKNDLKNITFILNITFIFLISINLFNILSYQIKNHTIFKPDKYNLEEFYMSSSMSKLPDIYYIVLDEYASFYTINDIFEYENKEFEHYLINKNFYIAYNSLSNATVTPKIMATILNMEITKSDDINYNTNLIRNSKVVSYLNALGYKTVLFPVRYYEEQLTIANNFDITFETSDSGEYKMKLNNFNYELLKTTLARPIIFKLWYKHSNVVNLYADYTDFIFYSLQNDVFEIESPKFVYAHIESPHPPYVFDENGNRIGVQWDGEQYYLGQFKHITEMTKNTINSILSKSDMPPVIIIQSDHGPLPQIKGSQTWFATKKIHAHNVFFAIYLPGICYDEVGLYDSISPVNTFRVLFNAYFENNFVLID